MENQAFPNYKQLTSKIPRLVWWLLRALMLSLTVSIIYLLISDEQKGLILFWKILIPLLPLCFVVIPGLWRNVCPMAFVNQLPRTLGFSKENTLSKQLRKLALYLSVISFIGFVFFRHPVLNHNGIYLGLILSSALILAFLGGLYFKGRSGWCGTFCPLAPIQKAYGHAPLVLVKNGYCDTCVGCQKNCYDFNPRAAVFSDIEDSDRWSSDQRKFFTALLPGLIFAFFNTSFGAGTSIPDYLTSMLLPILVSVGLFYALHNFIQFNFFRISSVFSMAALGIFYWYTTPVFASGVETLFGLQTNELIISLLQYSVLAICLAVVVRGLISERQFRASQQNSTQASLGTGVVTLKAALDNTAKVIPIYEQASGKQMSLRPGQSLLDTLEEAEMPIMSGCRMGLCGSDPVVVTDGLDNLEPPDENELNTLRRLGLEGKARLACCCKPKATITVDFSADLTKLAEASDEDSSEDKTQQNDQMKILIIGNGIAGISTAESLREKDPNCAITLISQEPYHFYNRMGLEKVIYGRSAMQGLYLMKEEWYQRNNIDIWLNTQVDSIDAENRKLQLATGESADYDKLVLATGAKAFVPNQEGFDLPAVFTLRSAEDALSMRSWVQQHHCKHVTVLGGGVLGVEAASALLELGLSVTIVQADELLMNRQLDENAATILGNFLENRGVNIYTNNGIDLIEPESDRYRVSLKNDETLVTDMVVLCIGIRADINLAASAGLNTNRGIIVDQQMLSSDENIFCVGDAAELPGTLGGLWSVGNEQGKIAADSILGGNAEYTMGALPPVQLKMSGIDMKSFGSFEVDDETTCHSVGSVTSNNWRSILIKDNQLSGGVFVNSPLAASAAINLSKIHDQPVLEAEITKILNMDDKQIKQC